ncbi:hypothetical protein [Yinghuangia sp. YIM S09857]|uniref:hypothetical protein n=1 Tax=Yinghuangia sp. YIM S09857 TaxID=3436929 RepID=UPI003F53AD5A
MTPETARRFPLVARQRPVCGPVRERAAGLSRLAAQAHRTGDTTLASAVLNQAALYASDMGRPDLARDWSVRHAQAHLRHCPVPNARLPLEPVVNLVRLRIRKGEGIGLLDPLYDAVSRGRATRVEGVVIPADLTLDHADARTWLWTVLLTDGTRAYTAAGRWDDAYRHLVRHRGIGARMLDGRQVAIIALALGGDIEGALELLDATVPGDDTEAAVAACLTALCRGSEHDLDQLGNIYSRLAPMPGLAVFHTKLGLAALDVLGDHPAAYDITAQFQSITDARAAEEVLAAGFRFDRLLGVVEAGGIGNGSIDPAAHEAVSQAEAVISRTASVHRSLCPGGG